MLFVERDMTAPVCTLCRSRRRERGAAAQMHDLNLRREKDSPAAGPDCRAEVDFLRVHEVALVEQADGLGVAAPHQERRAADPVRIVPLARHRFDITACPALL